MKDEVEDSTGAGMGTTKFKSSDSVLTMSIDCMGATAEVVLRYWGSEIEARTIVYSNNWIAFCSNPVRFFQF